MSLSPGTRLGPYEILSPLGAGGMGEVYLARDSRLDREVAIKVLPPHLAAEPEARARFEREARAVSSLNHPHICTLHDVGHENGTDFLVMERLDGETLAARLERGPLPMEDVLRIGTQIADALDRAHRSGLVHRDLKPGNIMLTKSGAKLLDFGLARPTALAAGADSLSVSPTLTRPLTAEGALVGTFHYMSPEQLEGKEADARSDIWALGLVLYEMATGRRAFEGKSQASLIAAVLERKPEPISSILPLAPPALSRLVEACIAKDAEERIQTAHDVKLQLQWVAEGGSKAGVPAPVAARRRSRERVAWIVAAAALVAVTALGLLLVMRRAPVEVPVRFIFAAPTGTQGAQWPRVSPDGSQIAFLAADSTGVDRIWVRSIDSYDARPLTGTEGAGRPFWSPDSRFLAYVAEGKLRKVPVAGGPIALIADTFERYDGSWGADGVILLDGRNGDSLLAVPAGGGVPKPATKLDRSLGESQHTWPFFLPDGRHFVFVAEHSGGDRSDAIKLGQLGSLESEVLGTCDSRVEFLAPGHLVFIRGGTLVAQRLDVGRRALVGEPIPITEEVALGRSSGDFSTSASGALAFRPGGAGVSSKLLLLDRTGRELKQIGEERGYRDVSISPDGRRVAVGVAESRSGREDIWVYDVERNTGSRLTFDPGDDIWPVWSADGSRIYFTSNRTGTFRCYSRQAGGVGGVDSLPPSTENMEAVVSCSPDGRWVVTTARGSGSNWDLWVRPADGGEPPRLFLGDPPTERDGVISPDGRWFAYRSDETGRNEIYVRSFPDGASKYQVTKDGGFDPAWASGGRELVYSKDGRIWAVPVTTAGAFQAGTPTPLFEANEMPGGYFERRFDITRDGQRFVINRRQGQTAAREFRVVLNLPEALGLTR